MKNFLRILAIIFLVVVGVTLLRSGILSQEKKQDETPLETVSVEQVDEAPETETLEEIVDSMGDVPPGAIILGGDGIPNN